VTTTYTYSPFTLLTATVDFLLLWLLTLGTGYFTCLTFVFGVYRSRFGNITLVSLFSVVYIGLVFSWHTFLHKLFNRPPPSLFAYMCIVQV